jgi:hypothetical protein
MKDCRRGRPCAHFPDSHRDHTEDWIFSLLCCSVDKMDITNNEDPNESKNEKSKVEAAAAAIILEGNYNAGGKKFSLSASVRETGIFEEPELSNAMMAKVKAEMKKQVHRKKTSSRVSLGGLETPGEARLWAAARLHNTESKGVHAIQNYQMALEKHGIDVTVAEIRAERNELKRKERQSEDDARPSKHPDHSTAPAQSSLEDGTTATVPSLAAASIPSFPAATSDEKNYETTTVDEKNYATTIVDHSLKDWSARAMTPHSVVASVSDFSVPGFHGFHEDSHCTTPPTTTLGRRLLPIFEEQQDPSNSSQDRSNPSQDFLARQEPSHVYSQYDLKQKTIIMETFRTELIPALYEPSGHWCEEFDLHKVKNALFRLVDNLRGRSVTRTTSVLDGKSEAEAIRTPHPIGPQLDPKRFPILSNFGVPLNDDRIISAMLTDIWQRNRDITGSTTLHLSQSNEQTLVMIPKPKSSSLDVWRRTQQRTRFLDEIAAAIDPDGLVTDDSRKKSCSLVATDKVYRPFSREIAISEGFPLLDDQLDEE